MASIFSIGLAGGEGKRLAPLTAHQACREQRRFSSASNTSATGDIPGARESPTSGCVPMRRSSPAFVLGNSGLASYATAAPCAGRTPARRTWPAAPMQDRAWSYAGPRRTP